MKKRLFFCIVLFGFLCNSALTAGAAENKLQARIQPIQLGDTTYQLKYVRADLTDPKVKFGGVLAQDRIAALANLDDMAAELLQSGIASLAMINGGYYGAYEKLPLPYGVIQLQGEFLHLGNIGSVFAVDSSGKSRVERLHTKISGCIQRSGAEDQSWSARGMNHRYQTAGEIILFTHAFGNTTGSHTGISVVVRQGIVSEIVRGEAAIDRDGFTLLIDDSEYAGRFQPGDRVTYQIETYENQISDGVAVPGGRLDWSDIVFALGAGPTLVKNGAIACDPAAEGFTEQHLFTGKEQRSFLAMTKAGELVFGTVAACSIRDLALAVQALGAENAINLDGGDSSAFLVDGVFYTQATRPLSNAVYLGLQDIPADAWAEAEITAAEANDLVPLILQRRYTEPISREEACQLAVLLYQRLAGQADLTLPDAESYLEQARRLALLSDLNWTPAEAATNCQRQQLMQLFDAVWQHFSGPLKHPAALISVDQREVAAEARAAVERLVAGGIVRGTDFAHLAPRAPATREMAVLISHRIFASCKTIN
ncbi:MAG: phosphodiester glycosidase family protein [Negativicutes bacterium]|nr:phosphodiester glycosidase family protein [Negativicutes bacterium]